jgi:signal transduction histidine kinase
LTAKQSDNMERILSAGNHLLNLINEVLDLSFDDVSVSNSLEYAENLLEPKAKEKNIRITNKISPEQDSFVYVDKMRFRQVLLNLLSNAIKYNKEGGSVIIEVEKNTPGKVRLRITDTGLGIPLDKQKDLFTPFDRLGAESKTIEGTGIGLTISKRLIKKMGGDIELESSTVQGSCFIVELPEGQNKTS